MKKEDQEAIASLQECGVPFLSSAESCDIAPSLKAPELVQRLIQSGSPRLKFGVTAFFLYLPHEAAAILEALAHLNKMECRLLKYYYTAAVYLQRLWKSYWLSQGMVLLPDYFSKELGLPSPELLHGKWGLVALEEALQQTAHASYNYISRFEALVRLLQQSRGMHAAAGLS